MRSPKLTTALFAVSLLMLTGCSTAHYFILHLTVTDADSGKPLSGVATNLDTRGDEERKMDHEYGYPTDVTGPDGQMTREFMISPYPSDAAHWYLKLKMDGYEMEVIEIKPAEQPKTKEKTPLDVSVRLRPTRVQPRPRRRRVHTCNSSEMSWNQ
jgi:hypothetical protein